MRCFFCGGEEGRFTTRLHGGSYVAAHLECPRAKNTASNEIDHPLHKENTIMAENNSETASKQLSDQTEVVPTSRLQTFVTKHPRAAKIVAFTGAGAAVVGIVQTARTLKANKAHLELAGDHAKGALDELSTSVTPKSTDV